MDRRKTDRRTDGNQDFFVFDINDLFTTLLRRKALLAGFMLMLIIPGMLYIIARPDTYEATATVMMEEPDYNLTELNQAMGKTQIDDATFGAQISILTSPTIAQKTAEDLAKAEPKREKPLTMRGILHDLTVLQVGRSRVLSISYQSRDPEETARVVNEHIQNYIDYRLDVKKQQIESVNAWLNEQVAKLKEDSQKKGQAIQEFRGESSISLGPDAKNLIYQQISELSLQLAPIETQKITLQSKADALQNEVTRDSLPEILESTTINSLKAQASQASQDLKAISGKFGKNHPERIAAQRRVSQVQGDLSREIAAVRSSITMQLESVTQQDELLRARIEELNKQADETQDQSITMEGLQGELEANRKLLAAYMDKFEEVKTKMDLSNSDLRIISPAEVPGNPKGPSKIVLSILLIMLSAFFATGAVLLMELIDRGIEDEGDVKRVLNLRLLGSLPATKNPLAANHNKGRNAYTEELKRIYIALAARKTPQTILVTSTQSGEGKTTVALSIAQYLSSIKSRVIIVDGDTHSPSLSTLAGTDVAPGFAELMSGATDYTKAIKRDGGNLAIIPAGDHDRYNVDILASTNFAQMLETLKSQYDYVIVDCANATSSTDAEVIAGQVDNVILVAQWNRTPKKKLKQVAETLRQHARDVPNVILNKRA